MSSAACSPFLAACPPIAGRARQGPCPLRGCDGHSSPLPSPVRPDLCPSRTPLKEEKGLRGLSPSRAGPGPALGSVMCRVGRVHPGIGPDGRTGQSMRGPWTASAAQGHGCAEPTSLLPPLFFLHFLKRVLSIFSKIIYLFLLAVGLCHCVWVFSSCRKGVSVCWGVGLFTVGASPPAQHGLRGAQAQQLGPTGLAAPQQAGSSRTRGWTHVPRISRGALNHWAAGGSCLFNLTADVRCLPCPLLDARAGQKARWDPPGPCVAPAAPGGSRWPW